VHSAVAPRACDDEQRLIKTRCRAAGLPSDVGSPNSAPTRRSSALPDNLDRGLLLDNISGDPEEAYFADGIAATDHRTFPTSSLFVIARKSSFAFRWEKHDVRRSVASWAFAMWWTAAFEKRIAFG
jgi:hypothetical protein